MLFFKHLFSNLFTILAIIHVNLHDGKHIPFVFAWKKEMLIF